MKPGQPKRETEGGFSLANLPARPKPIEGDYGKPVPFVTNYYRITFQQQNQIFYQLEMTFQPKIAPEARKKRKEVFDAMRASIEKKLGKIVKRGTMLWALKNPPQNLSFKGTITEEGGKKDEYTLFLKKTKEVGKESPEFIQVLNCIWKRQLQEIGMVEVGRNSKFYQRDDLAIVQNTGLMVWRGFTTSIQLINEVAYLNVDFSTRVLRRYSLLYMMAGMKKEQKKDLIGQTVLASYGNYRTYKIEGFDYDMNPRSTFIKDDKEITFERYYKEAYGMDIRDLDQPLVISSTKKRVPGKDDLFEEVIDEVLLIPELVYLTGMADEERKDRKLMQSLAYFTKLDPATRIQENQRLFNNQSLVENDVFTIDRAETQMPGLILHPPTFILKDRDEISKSGQVNLRCKILSPSIIKDWIVVFTKTSDEDREEFDAFLKILVEAAYTFGIQVQKPGYYFADGSLDSFCEKLENDINKNGKPQIVLTFLTNRESCFYGQLKQLLYLKLGVPHQNVLRSSVRDKKAMSVASNIILQMNAKLGCPLWRIARSLQVVRDKKIAIGGLAVYHKLINKGDSCEAFVGTIDNEFTKYTSSAKLIPRNSQRVESLEGMILKWIRTYFKRNSTLPDTLIVYRDGVGEGQIAGIATVELPALQKAVRRAVEKIKVDIEPEVILVFANKKVPQRIFENQEPYINGRGKKSSKIANPSPGSVIAGPMSRYNYDFFLVPQWVNQGTATPTHFVVVHNKSDLSSEALITLTYEQCYNYYNWKGAIRVPGSLMYANKLATIVGEYLKSAPIDQELSDKLYMC